MALYNPLTALASWIFMGPGNPGRLVLIEIHDKLGWLLILFAALHVLMRARRMARVYHKLYRERVADETGSGSTETRLAQGRA